MLRLQLWNKGLQRRPQQLQAVDAADAAKAARGRLVAARTTIQRTMASAQEARGPYTSGLPLSSYAFFRHISTWGTQGGKCLLGACHRPLHALGEAAWRRVPGAHGANWEAAAAPSQTSHQPINQ